MPDYSQKRFRKIKTRLKKSQKTLAERSHRADRYLMKHPRNYKGHSYREEYEELKITMSFEEWLLVAKNIKV